MGGWEGGLGIIISAWEFIYWVLSGSFILFCIAKIFHFPCTKFTNWIEYLGGFHIYLHKHTVLLINFVLLDFLLLFLSVFSVIKLRILLKLLIVPFYLIGLDYMKLQYNREMECFGITLFKKILASCLPLILIVKWELIESNF